MSSRSIPRTRSVKPGQDALNRFGIRSSAGNLKKHSTLAEYRRELDPELYGRLFKFSCVRNPWARMISFYFTPRRNVTGWDRRAFLELLAKTPGCLDFLKTTKAGLPEVDFVMRFERLQEDFNEACGRIGIPSRPLPHSNASNHADYREYYDEELVAAVANRFHREIKLFGYRFGA